jgi:hypothetical protein
MTSLPQLEMDNVLKLRRAAKEGRTELCNDPSI